MLEHAIATGRKKVTIVHKANIMEGPGPVFLGILDKSYTNASTRAASP